MNTSSTSKKIHCFGDSNTWGRNPQGVDARYPANVRWTGILQTKLGENFEVIEEGLPARTTNLDDPSKPGRNGIVYLLPCIQTHNPMDVVLLMLGTNDMKEKFNRSPLEIVNALEELVVLIKTTAINGQARCPHIIVLAPPHAQEEYFTADTQFTGAGEKSKELTHLIEKMAHPQGVYFLDLSLYAQVGSTDGIHLEIDAHAAVAAAVYEKITKLS